MGCVLCKIRSITLGLCTLVIALASPAMAQTTTPQGPCGSFWDFSKQIPAHVYDSFPPVAFDPDGAGPLGKHVAIVTGDKIVAFNPDSGQETSMGLWRTLVGSRFEYPRNFLFTHPQTQELYVLTNPISRWNGTAWVPVAPALTRSMLSPPPSAASLQGSCVAATFLPNGDLLAAFETYGHATPTNPTAVVARWNGQAWSTALTLPRYSRVYDASFFVESNDTAIVSLKDEYSNKFLIEPHSYRITPQGSEYAFEPTPNTYRIIRIDTISPRTASGSLVFFGQFSQYVPELICRWDGREFISIHPTESYRNTGGPEALLSNWFLIKEPSIAVLGPNDLLRWSDSMFWYANDIITPCDPLRSSSSPAALFNGSTWQALPPLPCQMLNEPKFAVALDDTRIAIVPFAVPWVPRPLSGILHVRPEAPSITQEDFPTRLMQSARSGFPTTLGPRIAGQKLNFQWYHNGEPISIDENPSAQLGHLKLDERRSSEGAYFLRAWNQCGSVQSKQIVVSLRPSYCSPADLSRAGGQPGNDGLLDNNDIVVFIQDFMTGFPHANLSIENDPFFQVTLDNNDLVAFLDLFFAGCE